MPETNLRVGLCGIGLDAYWPQFEGLRARLESYVREAAARLEKFGAAIEHLGMVDTPQRGREAGHACRRADVDLLVIYVTTYALSSTVLPIVQRARVPVLILNLQPDASIDYEAFNRLPNRTAMTGEWLAFCAACPVPEIANVLSRAGIAFQQVTGVLKDDAVWAEIGEWIAAARVKKALSENRLGLMGHYYSGMLDIQTDLTQVSITFGSHIEHLEVDELSTLRIGVSEDQIAGRIEDFRNYFDVQPDCLLEELARAARTSVALDQLIATHDLHSLAYYYMGSGVAGERRHDEFDHSGHIAPDRARHSGGRRVRGEERARDEDHGLPGRGWVVHRVLRIGSESRHRIDGARWAGPHCDCRKQDQGAASRGLSRKGGSRPIG